MLGTLKAFIKTMVRPITYAAESLLLFAVNNDFNRVSTLLIRCGVNVNCNNSDGTPLWHAVNNGNLYLVMKLLASNADVNSQANEDSRTVLHLAAQKNSDSGILKEEFISKENNEIIDALIAAKPNINLGDKDGQTPLHIAVGRCYVYATKAFIKAGANLNIRNHHQETPIMRITLKTSYAYNNARDVLRILIFAGAKLDLVDQSNHTLLQKAAACRAGFDQHLACKTLLFYGAKLEELTKQTNYMMHFEVPFNMTSMMPHEHDQISCMKKSASVRASISEKMHRLHTKKVSGKNILILHLHKLIKLPDRKYPNLSIRKVLERDLKNGCKPTYYY